MSDIEHRVLNLERLIQTVRLPALEVRVAALEQMGWQDSGSAYTAELGERVWVITLIGCNGLGLDGETVEILNSYGDGRVLGSATTDSSGVAVITTYGGDLSGNVEVDSSPARFNALAATASGTTGSVTFASYTLTPDASHYPGPLNDPRPWGASATLDDAILGVSGVSLSYTNPGSGFAWWGSVVTNYTACGTCGSVTGITLLYVFDPQANVLGSAGGGVYWEADGSGCPMVGTATNRTDTLTTLTSTPGSHTASVSNLTGTSKLYCAGAPTWSVTGT